MKFVTAKHQTENDDNSPHIIEILVKYNHGNYSTIRWEGEIIDGFTKEVCQTYHRNTTGLHYVEKAWIRQVGSNDALKLATLFLQENVDSPYFIQYGLNPDGSRFVTDK